QAACWRARRTESTPDAAASAWRWWRKPPSASKPRNASSTTRNGCEPNTSMSESSESIIDLAWEGRAALNPTNADPRIREAVEQTIADLNKGRIRVAERRGVGDWHVNQWIKKAVLLSFRL